MVLVVWYGTGSGLDLNLLEWELNTEYSVKDLFEFL